MMHRRTPSIRLSLILLVVSCILPVVIAAAVLIIHFYDHEQERLTNDAISRARAITSAVDRDIAVTQAALIGLSTSRPLASGDLAAFHAQARNTLHVLHAESIVLLDTTGTLLLSTARPFGQPIPQLAKTPLLKRVLATGQPGVSDLFIGPIVGHLIYTIAVPIRQDDIIRYSLNATVPPLQLMHLLTEQKLPDGWRVVITDSTGGIVARTHEIEKYLGKKVVPDLLRRINLTDEGAFTTATLDGIPVLTAYSRSSLTRWSVAIGIPTAELSLPLRTTLTWLIGTSCAALLIGMMLAWWLGGRISRSVTSLIQPALAVGSGNMPAIPRMYFKEAHVMGQALLSVASTLQQTQYDAQHDVLTGLANRALFRIVADQQLAICQRDDTGLAVLFLDLDGFKAINDTYGHATGDLLLRAVSGRIVAIVRESDIVARFGGDEFAIALMQTSVSQATAFGTRLIDALSQPYRLGEVSVRISASIGIAGYDDFAGSDTDNLLAQADKALYRAKALGKGRVCVARGTPISPKTEDINHSILHSGG